MTETYTLQFDVIRCFDCGRFWALEKNSGMASGICPFCSISKNELLQRNLESERRRNAGLRGALTRMKLPPEQKWK